jgi:hypothetical protein
MSNANIGCELPHLLCDIATTHGAATWWFLSFYTNEINSFKEVYGGIKKRLSQHFSMISKSGMTEPTNMNYKYLSMEELMVALNVAFRAAVTDS